MGVFELVVSAYVLFSLFVTYHDRLDTVLKARATPECVIGIIVGIILCSNSVFSSRMIRDAYFFSSFFEGDLDGIIEYGDLAAISGKSSGKVRSQLHFLRMIYMKSFSFINSDKGKIELYSKTCTCECRKCGAPIEKKVYFTGICPYCKGSDLFARVLTENRFYTIESRQPDCKRSADFYKSQTLKSRKILFMTFLCIGLSVTVILTAYSLDMTGNYFDKEYLEDVLMSGKSYSSYALIKREIADNILWAVWMIIAMLPLIHNMGLRLMQVMTAESCARRFSNTSKPFINASRLPGYTKKRGVRMVKGAICRHYLTNCSFVKQGRGIKVALTRKIVRDECPGCGASIVGVVDEKYKCSYCGNTIMDVIQKR